jgi:hypothetical protein
MITITPQLMIILLLYHTYNAMPLLSTSQSRWFLSVIVGLFSAVAISSSVSTLGGGGSMFSGRPGDIRMGMMLGVAGLVVVLLWYVPRTNMDHG